MEAGRWGGRPCSSTCRLRKSVVIGVFDGGGGKMDEPQNSHCTHNAASRPPPPVTDSPWFWAYVFACGGLIALLLMGPKYTARQSQIDKKNERRLQVAQSRANGDLAHVPLTDDDDDDSANNDSAAKNAMAASTAEPGISLAPLYIAMLILLSVAFFRFSRRQTWHQEPQHD